MQPCCPFLLPTRPVNPSFSIGVGQMGPGIIAQSSCRWAELSSIATGRQPCGSSLCSRHLPEWVLGPRFSVRTAAFLSLPHQLFLSTFLPSYALPKRRQFWLLAVFFLNYIYTPLMSSSRFLQWSLNVERGSGNSNTSCIHAYLNSSISLAANTFWIGHKPWHKISFNHKITITT